MKGLFKGLFVTFNHLAKPAITVHYPFKKLPQSERFRARHGLRLNPETGDVRCIGCKQCERICPDNLITVKTSKAPEGSAKKLIIEEITVDLSACMFCGLCEDVCPADAITLTPFFEMATQDKSTMLLDKQKLIDSAKLYEKSE
jgi:NADH-quinone oxidoreductase subunit I